MALDYCNKHGWPTAAFPTQWTIEIVAILRAIYQTALFHFSALTTVKAFTEENTLVRQRNPWVWTESEKKNDPHLQSPSADIFRKDRRCGRARTYIRLQDALGGPPIGDCDWSACSQYIWSPGIFFKFLYWQDIINTQEYNQENTRRKLKKTLKMLSLSILSLRGQVVVGSTWLPTVCSQAPYKVVNWFPNK